MPPHQEIASQFAGESRNQAAFDANSQKGNLKRQSAKDILPADFSIQGIGSNRSLVKWIYDSKLGEVSESFPVGDKYIVALVTEINNKGTMSVARARATIEPILRNQKKADILAKKNRIGDQPGKPWPPSAGKPCIPAIP